MFQSLTKESLTSLTTYTIILSLPFLIYIFLSLRPKPILPDPSKELAIVTGGSGAIGSKIILSLLEKGIKTINLDITPPSTSRNRCIFYKTDISNQSEIESTASSIRKEHGNPTILINNAALASPTPILKSSSGSKVEKVFSTNIVSHFYLLEAFLPDMLSRNHGHIVTVSSMIAFLAGAGNVDYACTKAATLALHEGLTEEIRAVYKKDGVKTTIVHPSWVRANIIKEWADKGLIPSSESIVEPEEVGEAIVAQIMSGTGAQILLPRDYMGMMIPFVRGLPGWIQGKMRERASRVLFKCLEGMSR